MGEDLSGKRYCFDLDETLCITQGTDYTLSTPMNDRITVVNKLYDNGGYIIIFTARGSLTGKDFSALTQRQLDDWGVRYHELLFGKPAADIYVDDKGLSDRDFFSTSSGRIVEA